MYPIPPIAEPTFADVPSEVSIAPASANPMVASLKKFSHLQANKTLAELLEREQKVDAQ